MRTILLTRKLLHQAATREAGWNYDQAMLLGVRWPLKKGWLSGLCGRTIPLNLWVRVMAMKGLSRKDRRQMRKNHEQV